MRNRKYVAAAPVPANMPIFAAYAARADRIVQREEPEDEVGDVVTLPLGQFPAGRFRLFDDANLSALRDAAEARCAAALGAASAIPSGDGEAPPCEDLRDNLRYAKSLDRRFRKIGGDYLDAPAGPAVLPSGRSLRLRRSSSVEQSSLLLPDAASSDRSYAQYPQAQGTTSDG